MRDEMGWSLAAISVGFSLRSFEAGVLAPFSGVLMDRLGPRRMAIAGVIIVAAGLFVFSQARDLRTFYAASLVIALGQSVGAYPSFSAAVMNWFNRNRGRAMGFMNAGNGGGYMMAPILAVLVGILGWRETLVLATVVILYFGLALSLLLHDRPEPYGYLPDGEKLESQNSGVPGGHTQRSPSSMTGMSVAAALRTPTFYLLAISSASSGLALSAWILFQIPHLQNVGFSLEAAALIGGIYGIFQITLRIVVGWVGDLVGRRRMYLVAFLFQGLGLFIFANLTVERMWLLPIYYVTYAFGHTTVIVLQMTLVADYFGTKRFATLRGLASTLRLPISVVSPLVVGWMFDQTGSYQMIFSLYAAITAMGALWVLLIRRPVWSELEESAA